MSHTLLEDARIGLDQSEQAESTTVALGLLAALLVVLAIALTVVGSVTSSAVLSLCAVAPLVAAVALFTVWNAREITRF